MGIKAPNRRRRNGLAAFRAIEPEVRAALASGWTLVAIYEEKRTRLGISYAQFARYAQPLRTAAKARPSPPTHIASHVPGVRRAAAPEPKQATGPGPPKGRPEEAVPTLDMDDFATKALNSKDLF